MKLRRACALLPLALLIACEHPAVTVTEDSPFDAVVLTAHRADLPDDSLAVTGNAERAEVTTGTGNTGAAIRAGWWWAADGPVVDQYSCATWSAGDPPDDPAVPPEFAQQGVLLRFDGHRAITLTKNVYGYVFDGMNVHEWDLSVPEGEPGRAVLVGSAKASLIQQSAPPGVKPLPWRVCARAQGPLVKWKVWPLTMPEPAGWQAEAQVSLVNAGRPGWYIGHLAPGATAVFTSLDAGPL